METAKVVKKIQALLNLSQPHSNSTEAESTAALSKVYELLEKHHLKIEEIQELPQEEVQENIVELHSSQISSKTHCIVSILNDFFHIQCIYHTRYEDHVTKTVRRKSVRLIGRETDVEVALYVFHFLSREFESLWKSYRQQTQAPQREKKGFLYGIYLGLKEKLDTQKNRYQQDRSSSHEMIPIDRGVQEYIEKEYPHLRRKTWNSQCDTSSLAEGKHAGKSIKINPGIHQAQQNQRLEQGLLLE